MSMLIRRIFLFFAKNAAMPVLSRLKISVLTLLVLLNSAITPNPKNLTGVLFHIPLDERLRAGLNYERLILPRNYASLTFGLMSQIGFSDKTRTEPEEFRLVERYLNTDFYMKIYFSDSPFSGFNVGLTVGHFLNQMTLTSEPGNQKIYNLSHHFSQFSAGFLLGYNFTLNDRFILGIDLLILYTPHRTSLPYNYAENGTMGTSTYDFNPTGTGRLNLNLNYRF